MTKFKTGTRRNGTHWFQINGRFVSQKVFVQKSRAEAEEIIRREYKPKELSKVVVFIERIRNTRVARTVRRAYPRETSDTEIQELLSNQYDNGGNYVLGVVTIGLEEMKPNTEKEVSRGVHGSADKGYMQLVM